ncbi:MAG TPA: orotidine-5'-phosphate decarboxylase [Rhizomicrobium sp.]|jgi:orotidine-5'-phosphate decarboxylase|nr:orotidine-5'-phosphate decarboxylase [Rhizomicrobium sp.]
MHGAFAPSQKSIPVRERLIFALDVASTDDARLLVERLGESVAFYKLGLELFMAGGTFEFLDWLYHRGKKIFVDLKFFDVPNTVGSAVRALRRRPANFVTVHGNDEILKAAVAEKGDLRILAVTALTSLDNGDLRSLGFAVDVPELVLSRARRALEIGCDGIVSSGLEAHRIRSELGEKLLIVVPGIRPVANLDDQKRTVDVEEAFRLGADYIVVGRPIRTAADPAEAAEAIQRRVAAVFG